MSVLSSLGPLDFLRAVLAMPPPGRAFSGAEDTVQAQVFTPPGNALAAVHAGAMRLLDQEADPAYAVELLPEWETDYGLPDPCTPAGATLEQRRRALLAKIASLGGQSRDYFIGVAAALGYTVTIEEFSPAAPGISVAGAVDPVGAGWRFVWRVSVPEILLHRAAPGISTANDPLWVLDQSELPCRLNAIKPAHTVLQFIFG